MKKLISSLLMVGLVGSLVLNSAEIGQTVIGVEAGQLKSSFDVKYTDSSGVVQYDDTQDVTSNYVGIKFAKYLEYGRVNLLLGYVQNESFTIDVVHNTTNTSYIGLSYDYMFYNSSKIIPFIGIGGVYSRTTIESDLGGNMMLRGFNYGGEVGVVYDGWKKFEIEAGARYLISNVSKNEDYWGDKLSIDVNSDIEYYLGVNYKF